MATKIAKDPTKSDLKRKRKAEKLKQRIKLSAPVPEGLKKAWERENRTKTLRNKRAIQIKERRVIKREEQAKRIEEYENTYIRIKKNRHAASLKARLDGNFYKPEDARVAIVIRIRGINRVSPKVRKVLQLFRLLQIHNGVFVRMNRATINMLKLIQPYIAFGYPSVNCIRSLLYKRGFAKIRHRPGAISRIPIMSNELIEKHLGKHGIESIEDMVFQIYTCGKQFKRVTNFLWPFKLNSPKKGYRGGKRRHFNEGGSYGNWEHHITNFVMRML